MGDGTASEREKGSDTRIGGREGKGHLPQDPDGTLCCIAASAGELDIGIAVIAAEGEWDAVIQLGRAIIERIVPLERTDAAYLATPSVTLKHSQVTDGLVMHVGLACSLAVIGVVDAPMGITQALC